MSTEYAELRNWLLTQAEGCVTAAGSRATKRSDRFFEANEAIVALLAENAKLKCALAPFAYAGTAIRNPEFGGGLEDLVGYEDFQRASLCDCAAQKAVKE